MTDIVDRLMNYDECHDDDVDEAAEEIKQLRLELARSIEATGLANEHLGRCYVLLINWLIQSKTGIKFNTLFEDTLKEIGMTEASLNLALDTITDTD